MQERSTLIVEAGHRHRQDLRLSRAGVAVRPARDHLDRHAGAAGSAVSSRPAGRSARAIGRPVQRRAAQGTRELPVPAPARACRAAGVRARLAARSRAAALPHVRAWSHDDAARRHRRAAGRRRSRIRSGRGSRRRATTVSARTARGSTTVSCSTARRDAQAADIVVVNHYLLMADLVLKEEGFGDLLPGADAIVIDEAHQLPDIAAQFLGFSVSTRQLPTRSQGRRGRTAAGPADGGQRGRRAGWRSSSRSQRSRRHWPAARCAARSSRSGPDRWSRRCRRWASRAYGTAPTRLRRSATTGQAAFERLRERLEERGNRLASLTATKRRAASAGSRPSARNVSVTTRRSTWRPAVAPCWRRSPCAWVLTSATLAVGDDFSHFKRRSGLARCDDAAVRESVRLRRNRRCCICRRGSAIRVRRTHARRRSRGAARASRRVVAVRSCCSRVIGRCATAPRSCAGCGAMSRRSRC